MWGYAPTVRRTKDAISYLFATKARKVMWIIGIIAVSTTLFAGSQSGKTEQSSANMPESTNVIIPSIDTKTPPDQSNSVQTVTDVSLQAGQNQPVSELHINNQTVPLPANGTVHKTIQNDDGQTKLDVSIDATSSGRSNSSSNVQLNVTSQQETTIENSE